MERQVKERRLREGSGEERRGELAGTEGEERETSQPLFKEVFMISALNRDGVKELRVSSLVLISNTMHSSVHITTLWV